MTISNFLLLSDPILPQLKGDATDPATPTPFDPTAPLGGSLGLLALGRLRRNDYGGWSVAINSTTLLPQASSASYQAATNATLTNAALASTTGKGIDSWRVEGNVVINANSGNPNPTSNTVTLSESLTSHAHLSQGFTLNATDRYLAFTVVNAGQQTNSTATTSTINDAFEGSLLNASTGAAFSAFGLTDRLSHSDAILNLQLDSTGQTGSNHTLEHTAANVRKVANSDGTNTYYIDLQARLNAAPGGLLPATPALLAFDRLGFAGQSSHVSIRDIKLIKDPIAFDDHTTTDEDATIAPLNNDLIGSSTLPSIAIVTTTQNTDGSFQYVPRTPKQYFHTHNTIT